MKTEMKIILRFLFACIDLLIKIRENLFQNSVFASAHQECNKSQKQSNTRVSFFLSFFVHKSPPYN